MSETTISPSGTEHLDNLNLAAEGLEAAQDELVQIQTVLDYYNESNNALNLTLEQATALKEEVSAKSDWVDYLATRDYENVNGVVQGADSRFRTHDSTERGRKRNNEHYDSTQETEYSDRSYNELINLAEEATQNGDKTTYNDVSEAILDKIAVDAERNSFSEEQTDRLYDRVVLRIEKKRGETPNSYERIQFEDGEIGLILDKAGQTTKWDSFKHTNSLNIGAGTEVAIVTLESGRRISIANGTVVELPDFNEDTGEYSVYDELTSTPITGNLPEVTIGKAWDLAESDDLVESVQVRYKVGSPNMPGVKQTQEKNPFVGVYELHKNVASSQSDTETQEVLEEDSPEQSKGSSALWYLRHPGAAMQLGFARLQQLPGRAVEGLARIYRNENGEVDKKKLGKHILIGAAVTGVIVAIAYAAKKAGAEGNVNDAMDTANNATNNVNPSLTTPTPPRGGGSSVANTLPPNPAIEQVSEHVSKVFDIDLGQRPWDVAREVGEMLGRTTRETLDQAKDVFNQQYNTSFELVKIGGVEQYMNGPHSMSPEQQQLFNELLAKLATG